MAFDADKARAERAEGMRKLGAEYRVVMALSNETKKREREYLEEQERKEAELRAWVRPKP